MDVREAISILEGSEKSWKKITDAIKCLIDFAKEHIDEGHSE